MLKRRCSITANCMLGRQLPADSVLVKSNTPHKVRVYGGARGFEDGFVFPLPSCLVTCDAASQVLGGLQLCPTRGHAGAEGCTFSIAFPITPALPHRLQKAKSILRPLVLCWCDDQRRDQRGSHALAFSLLPVQRAHAFHVHKHHKELYRAAQAATVKGQRQLKASFPGGIM